MTYTPPDPTLILIRWTGATYAAPNATAIGFSWESPEEYREGKLAAALPAPSPSLALEAQGEEWEPSEYIPPSLKLTVEIAVGYVAPPLDHPIVLCEDYEPPPGGVLSAPLPPPELPLALTATLGQVSPGTATASLPSAYPGIEAAAFAVAIYPASATGQLPTPPSPELALETTGSQNLDLPDNGASSTRTRHGKRYPDAWQGLAFRQHHGQRAALHLQADNQVMEQRRNRLAAPQAEMIRFQRPVRQGHQHGIDIGSHIQAPYAEAIRTRASKRERHQHGIDHHGNTGLPHADTIKRRPSVRLAEQQAQPAGRGLGIGNREAWPAGTRLEVRWTKADHPAPGYWWPIYQPPGLRVVMPCDDYQPPALRCPVLLGKDYPQQPYCPPEPEQPTIIIPIREEYRVINTLTVTELDGTAIDDAEDFSASIDTDSWTWSWNARIPASAMPQVRPDTTTRVELIATINGEPLRLVVESINRERKFGQSWLRVSGRGRAAFLADPMAPAIQYTNDAALTAQQALAEALQDNGVPIGWTLDWQIEDWQIPAGIWSHNGTWIDAAKRIAEAGGGYVQAHDTDQTLRILPRYPTAPWAWNSATPEISLPEDVVEVEGIEWQEKPAYNAVWVHGGEQGLADRIIVGSTGGTNPAPTIVDELATDPAMTRQRGLALLGDTGKQASISLRLPVLPETGMIRPGALIEYHEQGETHRGLVRSLNINQNWPQLWQTIGVETHE